MNEEREEARHEAGKLDGLVTEEESLSETDS